jgi:hypothetical protein
MGLTFIMCGTVLGVLLESWLIPIIWVMAGLLHIYTARITSKKERHNDGS